MNEDCAKISTTETRMVRVQGQEAENFLWSKGSTCCIRMGGPMLIPSRLQRYSSMPVNLKQDEAADDYILPKDLNRQDIRDTTGIPYFIMPCFIALHRYCVFYKLKICGNPASSRGIWAIFPTAFAHLVLLCHILVIIIFQTFS